ncbi:MAG: ATP-binding protein, partial [Candidatus Marinimicrobia bacterium]|nr:ATP-binding protein [Candidatus Neomarinimicrobiota bacterium]
LNMIAEQADRCKKIVSGLLNFARQNKVSYKMIDLNDLIDNFTTMVELPQNVQIRLAHGLLDPLAEIDADQIVQVLINLVNNSITAMPNGGIITIKTTGIDDMVGISVSDTGTGIPKEYLSKIFEPFFTTKKVGQGTGLGLSIIYGIIKMHSGDIRVESNTDPAIGPTGTTFNITLPRIRKKITNPVA